MQKEITERTRLLDEDGCLAAVGWARRNLFEYDRRRVKARSRLKEWDFYQISDGELLVQINFFNIAIASAATAALIDMKTGKKIACVSLSLGTRNRYILPDRSDTPNYFRYDKNGVYLEFDTCAERRKILFGGVAKGKKFRMRFDMYYGKDDENITIVTPFREGKDKFFLTTKQNCMPCEGKVTWGKSEFSFSRDKTFAVLDWGRGVWPHKNVWYWGNGATFIDGKRFGFEITWKIGDTSQATETCLFYDGKAHKIGAVDVEKFPGEGNAWMKPWHFTSDDGRFDVTMTPFYDNKSGAVLFGQLGMKTHQVHGLWNGYAVLDDGTKVEIKDMYAFCEYVVNAW